MTTEAERLAQRYEVPAPEVTSQPVDPAHPSLPRSVRTAVKAAVGAGHTPQVFWARGPRLDARGALLEAQVTTIGLRVDVARTRRVVMMWRQKDQSWVFEEAFLRPGRTLEVEGAPYRLLVEKVDSPTASAAIKEGWT
jgi:hypothetical protein